MMETKLIIRPATESDAHFLAINIYRALLIENPTYEMIENLTSICRREDTLYSWRNAVIAEYRGEMAGILISYDGARYKQMRDTTFPLFAQFTGEDWHDMDDEALPGEWYGDSLSVLPEFCGNGIGTELMRHLLVLRDKAHAPLATLAVDPENPKAQRLYESLGFHYDGNIYLFGHNYLRMVCPSDLNP